MKNVMLWLLSIVLILTVLRNGWYLLNASFEGVLLFTAVGSFAIVLMYLVVKISDLCDSLE